MGHGFEGAGGGEGLLEDLGFVDAGDEDGDGLGEAVAEGFEGFEGFAVEEDFVAEGLHGEDADALFEGDGHDFVSEGAEVGVHDVDGHLDGVEVEVVLLGCLEHAEVDGGVFVAGKADVAELAGLAGFEGGFEGSAYGEDAVGVFEADDLVELDEVDHVGLEAAERLLELLGVLGFGAAVELGHLEDLGAVAVAEGLAHADLGDAVVVVPAVVHEGDAAVDGGADELDGLFGGGLLADVEAAEADGGDALAGGAEVAVDHVWGFRAGGGFGGLGLGLGDGGEGGGGGCGGGGFEEVSALHKSGVPWIVLRAVRGLDASMLHGDNPIFSQGRLRMGHPGFSGGRRGR